MKVYDKNDVDVTFSNEFMDLEQLTSFDAIPLDKVKQAREKIEKLDLNDYGDNLYQFQAKCTEILDKLIESEEK